MVRYYSTQIFYHGFNFLHDIIAEGLDGARWDAHSHQQSLVKKGDLIKRWNISPRSRLIVSERVGHSSPGQGRVPGKSNGSWHHASFPVNDQIQLVQCHEGNISHSNPSQPQSHLKTNYERSVRIKAATHNVMVLSQASAAMKAKVPLTSELWEMNQSFLSRFNVGKKWMRQRKTCCLRHPSQQMEISPSLFSLKYQDLNN